MEQRISFMTLGVSDLNRSANFYETIFGWKRSEMSSDGIVFFQMNGLLLSLYNRESLAEDATVDASGSGFKTVTISYLTRSKAEVDDTIEMLRSKGVTIVKEPQHVFWGGYSSYIADPDGHLWEIAFNPFAIPEL